MRRRDLIATIGLAMLWPTAAVSESVGGGRLKKVGVLWHAGNADEEREYQEILVKAFHDLGYIEGKNVVFLHKYPAEQADRYPVLARELINSNVDLLIAVTQDAAVAFKQATTTIPVVFVIVNDPVGLGLAESLAHPGGNLTGLSLFVNDFSGKRLDLLRQAVPGLSRVAMLINPNEGGASRTVKATKASADALGISVTTIEATTPEAIEAAFDRAEREKFQAGIVGGSLYFNERARVGALALAHKIPMMTVVAEMVPYGLLMSYGQDFPEYFRKAAVYSAKILGGTHPADLPVEQPTRLKFVVNLKVAKALGLSLPAPLLISADETIE